MTEHFLEGEREKGKIACQPPTPPRSVWGPECGSGLGLRLGKRGKDGTQGWGVCMKVSLKFESPDFLEHSRQQRSSFLLETSWLLQRTRLRPMPLRVMLVRRVCCCYFPATEVGSHRLSRETHRKTHRTWVPGAGVIREDACAWVCGCWVE